MTCLKFTLSAPGTAPAWLEFEHAVINVLARLGRDMFGAAMGLARDPTVSQPDDTEIVHRPRVAATALSRPGARNDSGTRAA